MALRRIACHLRRRRRRRRRHHADLAVVVERRHVVGEAAGGRLVEGGVVRLELPQQLLDDGAHGRLVDVRTLLAHHARLEGLAPRVLFDLEQPQQRLHVLRRHAGLPQPPQPHQRDGVLGAHLGLEAHPRVIGTIERRRDLRRGAGARTVLRGRGHDCIKVHGIHAEVAAD
eukprot:scaffold124022_cov67-Phaeocystis_antarctica.AAC.10